MSWVGRSIPRSEDPALLAGNGRFVADLAGGCRHMAIVRSSVARGRIRGIEIPDGATVITAADLAGVRPIRPVLFRPDFVPLDQPILAGDRVTFVGQPIAAVIAASAAEAEDIAEEVAVDIEPEAPVTDANEALAAGAPIVHPEAPANTIVEGRMETPGFTDAIAGAHAVIEVKIRSRRQNAMPLEARGGVARFDPSSGRITLNASVQMPHLLRTGLADTLGIAEADLRVVAPDVGGGFGQKMPLIPEYVLLVWAASRYRGDFAWIEDRRENLIAAFHSRDQYHTLRGAFDADARLVAIEADIRCNVGAFHCYPITSGVEALMGMAEMPGPYEFAHYKVRSRAVTTNTCPMAPFRGVTRPVLTLSMERMMDEAAKRFAISPPEIRRRNLVRNFPYRSASGLPYDIGSYVEAMEEAERLVELTTFRVRQEMARAEGRYLGIGFSVFNERSGYGTPAFAARSMEITLGFETVDMAMDPSGRVEVRIGASPHGQGLRTTLAQIIADELGLTPDDIRVVHGDTDRTPYGWGTFASRSLVIAGGACKGAAGILRDKVVRVAARLLQAEPGEIEVIDGVARVKGSDSSVDIKSVARAAWHQSHLYKDDLENGLTATATYDPGGTYSNACHVAIVEVDVETGAVAIERFLIVEDAGRLINPVIADGQITGGVAQGIANALYEEIVYDEDGNILTATLADYLPPTMAEVPEFEIHHLETISPETVTGAKGLGEGGTVGAPAAILNAIADALVPFGVAPFEMPATPRRIRALLREARESQG